MKMGKIFSKKYFTSKQNERLLYKPFKKNAK